MKHNLTFDFSVNKENNTITVAREFAAERSLVWAAYTQPEILDQWWAPHPWKARTKTMDFREGGHWHYAMVGPKGEEHWAWVDYKKIQVQKKFTGYDAFADADGNVNKELPQSKWEVTFADKAEFTLVTFHISYDDLAQLEATIQMGFKEGFEAALTNLDQYIESQFKIRKELKLSNKARVTSYLNFPGNTEEVFMFYKSVFGTEFSGKGIQRFEDIPQGDGYPPIAENIKKMVLHVELPILNGHVLMATDAPKEMGFTLIQGNNMHICLEPETREETERIFNLLSAGGVITMPLQDMFFGAYFAEFTDKYGINWMLNHQTK
jgi:PhnB protein